MQRSVDENFLSDRLFSHLLDWLFLNFLAVGDRSNIQLGLLSFFTLAYVSMIEVI
jgi:hypothetical protein